MLTKSGWQSFEESPGWQEVLATVKERMRLINLNILSPETCNSEEKRVALQTEYMTCLWFINLPKFDALGGAYEKEPADPASPVPANA